MNLEEKEMKRELRKLRSMAEVLGQLRMFETPELQAEELLTGRVGIYRGVIDILVPGASRWAKKDLEKKLREIMSPVDVIENLILSPLQESIENLERALVEKGYRVPKWERPKWLKDKK